MLLNEITRQDKEELPPRITIPPVIFGTSSLGNLYESLSEVIKLQLVEECIRHSGDTVVFDSAGKYGAGLALETLGKCLRDLNVSPDKVLISNKLGWVRTELTTSEPTFEPGIWKDLKHDARQSLSYQGILECFEQGNELLGGYIPQMVSVHDPDEYLATATSPQHAAALYEDILEAYKALNDLRKQGKVEAIGVGAKSWKTIQKIAGDVDLDWVMFANSMTILQHPKDLQQFMQSLSDKGVVVINSAVFHSGFLIGSNYYDYKLIEPDTDAHKALFQWRDKFFDLCKAFDIKPAAACVQFALRVPGVSSIALNTTSPKRVKDNLEMAHTTLPSKFWEAMKEQQLIDSDFQI